jgi:hypothetical protein
MVQTDEYGKARSLGCADEFPPGPHMPLMPLLFPIDFRFHL